MRLNQLRIFILAFFGSVMISSVASAEVTCSALSSRGPSYNSIGHGNTVIEAQQQAMANCGPNCNGKKGTLMGYNCDTGFHGGGGWGQPNPPWGGGGHETVTCTAFSSRGPAYDATVTGSNILETRQLAINTCGPNCNGKKGTLVRVQCF